MSEKAKTAEKKSKVDEVKAKVSEVQSKKESAEKQKTLQAALANIEKQFGKGSIMKLGDGRLAMEQIDSIPTGSVMLDI